MGGLRLVIVFIILLFFLSLRFFFYFHTLPTYHDGQQISFQTTLLSEPQRFSTQQRIYTRLEGGKRIFITTSLYPQFHYADRLFIEGALKHKKLDSGNVILTMSYPEIEVVKDANSLFLAIPSFIREKSISLFERTLPSSSSGLLLGIIFGVREGLGGDLKESLRIAGVFHVVATSGMHVTFVGSFLSSVFGWFFKRQIAIIASIAGICLYAVITGFNPPIIRASIMAILAFSARILGRQSLATYGLILAAFTMIMWSPSLIFDIGFQLSVLATLGLLYIQPILEGGASFKRIINNSVFGSGVVTAVAAQTATLPILLSNFGIYSLWSVVANGLVLWTIPGLMVIGGIGAVVGIAIPSLGQLILYLSLPFLLYFEKIIMFFGRMEGVVGLENLPWQMGVGYYLLVAAIVLFIKRRNKF